MSYKTFQNGFPLPASDLNNYLMNQTVATFANSTARASAITAPQEGQVTYLEDTDAYEKWDGSAWVDFFPASTAVSSGNAIINGAFDIWQRGTSFTPTAAAWTYTADRWDSGRAANTTGATISRQASGQTGFEYSLRYQRTASSSDTSALYLVHRFESSMSIPLAGQTVTLSFYAKKGANYSASSDALNLYAYSGTGTNQGGFPSTWTGSSTLVNNQAFTLTTSWQRFEVSYSIGSTATQLGFLWQFNPTGTAGADDWYEITGVQLEVGSTATDFRRNANSIQGELAACQRYYYRITANQAYSYLTNPGYADGTTLVVCGMVVPATMRINPSSVEYSGIRVAQGTTNYAVSALVVSGNSSSAGLPVVGATTSGVTSNTSYILRADNNSSAYIGISAEL